MHGRNAILATLVIAFGLGLYSFVAIRRTAGRRSALVDEVAALMPAIPGARVISPWEPATYADDVRAMYCLDGVDPTSGAARAINALTAAGWTTTETRRDAQTDTFAFLMAGPLRLRGGVALGKRADCDGAKRQVTLALDGTR
ncbi:MAG TPA: hypothetical protein VMT47_14080 [Polyangia bacterium]|nr:hypothetical protein [Polyangia bacterium]